jgi:glyoxylase-like metal-dependent hydrolase (beta-lactamase superfamily II)
MKIRAVVSALAALALIATGAEGQGAGGGAAGGRGGGGGGGRAGGPPQVTETLLAGNVYGIDGQGGRISALVGPDGVFMVDAQGANVTEGIVAAIRRHTDTPIKMLVNTHVHADHTGGNENFGKMGVTIMARTSLRNRLARPAPAANDQTPAPAPAAALPVVTYDSPMTIQMNGETVEIIPLPNGHTDGDTAVRFTVANVLATGDVFRSTGYPNIDRANGGTLAGMIESMNKFIELTNASTKVVPGHGPVTDRAALIAHRDMIVLMRDRVQQLIREGRTLEQIVAAKPTADHDATVGANADRFVQQLFEELRGR